MPGNKGSGVGTTRTVDMRGGIIGAEQYLVWEPFTRMTFRFNECSTKAVGSCSTSGATPKNGLPQRRKASDGSGC
jgi:hypothetical protein